VLVSWLVAAPSVLAFAALGLLVSIVSRNGLAGVIVPTVVGLVLQLVLLVAGIGPVRAVLPNAGFIAWHGMWASPSFLEPIAKAVLAALVYATLCLAIGWRLFRRRDVTAS
jgi:ABC-2 type transport system permease protein